MAPSRHIRLIAGLGNPGAKYELTRHNAGFWFVDQLARRAGATLRHESKLHGDVARIDVAGHEVWLIKPDTFMNLSGQAVAAIANFYKIPVSEVLVVHDEIDLPPGTVRLKRGGGHGGHNGLRDIMSKLGKDFVRLRVGVGRPEHSSEVTNFVLRRAPASEQDLIDRSMEQAEDVLALLLEDGLEKAMHRLHSARDEPSVPKKKKPRRDEAKQTTSAAAQPVAPAAPGGENAAQPADAPLAKAKSLREQLAGMFRRKD